MKIEAVQADRSGMSLIEIIAALIIAATVTAVGIRHLTPVNESSRNRSCELTRQVLQNDVKRYRETTGQTVSSNLREIAVNDYSGNPLPTCPGSGSVFRLNRSGQVECPSHP